MTTETKTTSCTYPQTHGLNGHWCGAPLIPNTERATERAAMAREEDEAQERLAEERHFARKNRAAYRAYNHEED